jgi:hypothetical protein
LLCTDHISNYLDMYTALDLALSHISSFTFLPQQHSAAFGRYIRTILPTASDPFASLHISLLSIESTILSMLSSLSRPHALINNLVGSQRVLERHRATLRKTTPHRNAERSGWPSALPLAGLLEENRRQAAIEAQEKTDKAAEEVRLAGCELSYTYQTVASELASWQELHGHLVKQSIRELARGMVIKEKARLDGMKRALRIAREATNPNDTTTSKKELYTYDGLLRQG